MSEDDSEDLRLPWNEGPDKAAAVESWLLLSDDDLLHRIETLAPQANEDDRLIEVVESDRHFFIRQEAAKRVRDRNRLFDFEDDRHVGQILVRYLTRREDVTYLERLSRSSRHVEVRSAAQVQLARLWRRLDAPAAGSDPPPATAPAARPRQPSDKTAPVAAITAASPPSPAPSSAVSPAPPAPVAPKAGSAVEPVTSAALEKGGVDGSLLAWAIHFIVAPTWSDVGTERTRELLTKTRRELLGPHPTLVLFEISKDAHVTINLDAGPRLPSDSVRAVAAWMTAYRKAARRLAPEGTATSVRALTATVADALREAGFYGACDALEGGR